jgi:AraC-like DNA-binding protein
MGTMSGTFRCRYAGTTSDPRYDMWQEEFARRWIVADFEPIGTNYVVNQFSVTDHSFLSLCTMRSTPGRFDRRSDPANDDYRYLIVASGSHLRARQRDRSIDLSSGQMTLISVDEPAQVAQITEGTRWSIRISHKLLLDYCGNVDDNIARRIDASDLTKLLLHHIETAHRFGPKLDVSANHAIAQHTLDLVGLCLGADGDAAELARHRGLAAARLEAVKAEILRRLGRPELGLAHIAASHGVSTRYIQHLFELSGESFTGFVLERRLLAAYRLLAEPKSRWRKISDIAAATSPISIARSGAGLGRRRPRSAATSLTAQQAWRMSRMTPARRRSRRPRMGSDGLTPVAEFSQAIEARPAPRLSPILDRP